MTRRPDLVEIVGKNALIGDLAQRLDGAYTESQINRKKASRLAGEAIDAREALLEEQKAHEKTKKELAERDALIQQWADSGKEKDAIILDWMHSNEAFKQLARAYGKKLGLNPEQSQSDLDEIILDVAEENPAFEESKLYKKVKTKKGPA